MSNNLISNAKLYIDFGATQGGSAGGAIWLQRAKDLKDSDGRSVEVKKAIGVPGGAGVIFKEGGGTLTLSEYRQDAPQVRWRKLRKEKKFFVLAVQDEGGVRQKFFNCTVSKVDRSLDEEGSHMDEIEIVYLSSEESA